MSELPRSRGLAVLIVEDDPGDLLMLTEAVEEADSAVPRCRVHVARDGDEALAFLQRRSPHGRAPVPDLVLLDLNLPGLDGHEVLAAVKTDPALAHIPVVVLSTSDAAQDVRRAYNAHANAFVTKPADFAALAGAVRDVLHTFCVVATLPTRTG